MIRVAFTASNTIVGKLIRLLTRGRVSHCIIQYPDELWGGEWVVEATLQGVRMIPAEKARHNIVAEFECLFDAAPALKKIRNEVGSPYDFQRFFVLGLALIGWRLLKLKIRKPMHSTNGNLCSEFVAKLIMVAGLDNSSCIDPESITPEELLKYCETHIEHFKQIKQLETYDAQTYEKNL
jgi:hypothetical protein